MLAYLFVLFAVAFRFLPHPWTFTPVGASLLFFGARMPRRQAWVPLLLLAGSDVVLTRAVYGYPFFPEHFASWAWYAAMLWMGGFLKGSVRPWRLAGAALTASVSFFLVSNFSVWASSPQMYPRTLSGLFLCYAAGLPFFRNELAGDFFFTAVLFSIPLLLQAVREWMEVRSQ